MFSLSMHEQVNKEEQKNRRTEEQKNRRTKPGKSENIRPRTPLVGNDTRHESTQTYLEDIGVIFSHTMRRHLECKRPPHRFDNMIYILSRLFFLPHPQLCSIYCTWNTPTNRQNPLLYIVARRPIVCYWTIWLLLQLLALEETASTLPVGRIEVGERPFKMGQYRDTLY